MKPVMLLALLLLISTTGIKADERGELKSQIPFLITKKHTDTKLAAGTSRFTFTILENDRKLNAEVWMGFNDEEFTLEPDKEGKISHQVVAGKYVLYFYIDNYFEVITDTIEIKSQEVIEAEVRFQKADVIITVDKPVIYLYPEKETRVSVLLNVNGKLGFTYPVYHEGWEVTATPEGKIKMDGKEYNYLFWESEMPENLLDKNNKTGFLVSSDTLLSFLENSLDQMGFTPAESADFITYWYPQMMKNEKNHVQFLFNEACDTYGQLNISPQPDHIFRVGMIWSKTDANLIPEPQTIPSVNRNGFVVIEWGGMETDQLFSFEN